MGNERKFSCLPCQQGKYEENLEKAAQYIEYIWKGYGYLPKAQEFTAETFVHRKQEPTKENLKFPYLMEKVAHKTRNIIAELKWRTAVWLSIH